MIVYTCSARTLKKEKKKKVVVNKWKERLPYDGFDLFLLQRTKSKYKCQFFRSLFILLPLPPFPLLLSSPFGLTQVNPLSEPNIPTNNTEKNKDHLCFWINPFEL